MSHPVDRDALDAFVAVARSGTVREAAATLGRTQPSISARLAGLESAWGVRLFFRRPRGMEPTPEGRRLLPLAEQALAALDAVDRGAGRPVRPVDEVRIGCGDALGRHVLPDALGRLQSERPGLAVRVLEGSKADLVESLRSGELDLALVSWGGDDRAAPDLETTALLRSRVLLMTSAGRPAPRRRRPTLREVALRGVVTLLPGSSFRRSVERAFRAANVPWRPAVEVGSFSLVRRFVSAGLGVAPVPEVAFADGSSDRSVLFRPLAGVPPVDYHMVRRAKAPLSEPARRLVALLGAAPGGRGTGA